MGKPIAPSRADVEKCAWALEWFRDHGPSILEPEQIATEAVRWYASYVPAGCPARDHAKGRRLEPKSLSYRIGSTHEYR
jgi:hypothetical protein